MSDTMEFDLFHLRRQAGVAGQPWLVEWKTTGLVEYIGDHGTDHAKTVAEALADRLERVIAMLDLRPAEEWAARKGIVILDPDGWRDGTPWWLPISEEDFEERAAQSTQRPITVTVARPDGSHEQIVAKTKSGKYLSDADVERMAEEARVTDQHNRRRT